MTDFNRIAPYYDFLKKVVFQTTLDKATNYFIADIPHHTRILIIGGGTGELLKHFNATQSITYIEQSAKMISSAEKRAAAVDVEFICADILQYPLQQQFDCIVTPFILDCFQGPQLNSLISKLTSTLKTGGLWLHSDFYAYNGIQKSFIKLLYFFFRKTASLRVNTIPDFDQLFSIKKYIIKKNVRFKRGLIQSTYYRKIA